MQIAIVFCLIGLAFVVLDKSLNIFGAIVTVDLFLRIVKFILNVLPENNFQVLISLDKYMPDSLVELIDNYATGTIHEILFILYIISYLVFIFLFIRRIVRGKES